MLKHKSFNKLLYSDNERKEFSESLKKENNNAIKYSKNLFSELNNDFMKLFINKGIFIDTSVAYNFCVLYIDKSSSMDSFDFYKKAIQQVISYSEKNNICIVFCLVTNSEYDQNLYDNVLCSIQQELYIERKIQDYDIRTEYIKTITFLSMFDLYIMNTSETEFWGWYLNYNYNYVPIYARNELKESPYFSNIDNIKLNISFI
jgi:hypothetical protein